MPLEGRRGGRTDGTGLSEASAGARPGRGGKPPTRALGNGRVAAQRRCDTSVSIAGRARVGRSHRMQVYALTSTRLRHETLDLFLTREAAEAELQEILEDEPDWKDVLRVVPIELDERDVSAN